MSVSLMHYLETKVGTVEHISPSVHHMTLTFNNGLVEVEAVEVEGHGGDAEGGKPDANDRPGSQEEVKTTAIIE